MIFGTSTTRRIAVPALLLLTLARPVQAELTPGKLTPGSLGQTGVPPANPVDSGILPDRVAPPLDDNDLRRPGATGRVQSGGSPFELNLAYDLPLTVLGLASSFVPMFASPRDLSPGDLDPNSVNALDRSVIGNDSSLAATASDITLGTALVLPFVADFIDLRLQGHDTWLQDFGVDAMVLLEAYAVNALVTNAVKLGARRPRPYMYDPDIDPAAKLETEGTLSFFSGHTSGAFAMAGAYSYLYMRRHPDSSMVVPVWVGTHLLAATTGVLRVQAGKHFWSDVLVGALVGSAIGIGVPYLHDKMGKIDLFEGTPVLEDMQILPKLEKGGASLNFKVNW